MIPIKIGVVDLQTLKQKMDEIRSKEAELNDERVRLETELHKAEAQELNEEKLLEWSKIFGMIIPFGVGVIYLAFFFIT